MKTHVTEPAWCPECGAHFNRCTTVNGDGAPEPGDVTVCIRCAELLEFGPELELRRFAGVLDPVTRGVVARVQSLVRKVARASS